MAHPDAEKVLILEEIKKIEEENIKWPELMESLKAVKEWFV